MNEDFAQRPTTLLPQGPSFLKQHGAKLLALLFWSLLVGGYYIYTQVNNLTLADSLALIVDFLTSSFAGPLFFVLLYTLRPLLFFPATLLTLLAGFLFGPIGILYTVLGGNASAMMAYGVGRYFGQGLLDDEEDTNVIQKYTRRLRNNSFETVLVMRLIFLPYDLVNYAAGFLKIKWQPFLLATAVGSLPGTISVVLLGGSFGTLEALMAGNIQLDPLSLTFSIVLILVSIGLSRFVKGREAKAAS
ncbi:TVP38/TMEM64 family protein [Candidatus Leptofilum sp.]|uniref:TVP38/TMEM64 family protein n=1 Tax=Candidatus Leptofilum sp. TaxID=3241576 RepID=UPI003B597E38